MEEALDRTMWRARFGRGFGPVVRQTTKILNYMYADPGGRAVYGVGLQPQACWDCGFESHQGHGCLFLVGVLCVVRQMSLRGADHSSTGVLPSAVRTR